MHGLTVTLIHEQQNQPNGRCCGTYATAYRDGMHDTAPAPDGAEATEPEVAAYTVPQAARALALSERQVWAMTKSGELGSYKVGWARRIPATAINEFIARRLAA